MRRPRKLPDFGHSMTDLMASVAVTFLLLAAIFMLHASEANRALQTKLQSVDDVQQKSVVALGELVSKLHAEPKLRDAVQTDPHDRFVLSVEFPEDALYFRVGSDEIVADDVDALLEPLRRVVQLVCDVDQQLTNSIVLEGHTDPQGRRGDDGYQYNVGLSARRAQKVYFAVRKRLQDDEKTRGCMDTRFTVAGRGPVEPKRFAGRWDALNRPADDAADRRVVLKVRFTSGGEALARAGTTP